ncbi:MAG: hypothetical protein AAF639_40750, partial [Chloroflexota bacterium]
HKKDSKMNHFSVIEGPLNDEYTTLVDQLCSLAETYFYAGRLPDAVHVLKRGAQILHENPDAHTVDQVRLLIQYGRLLNWTSLMQSNHLDESAVVLKQAYHLAQSIDDEHTRETQQAYAKLYQGNLLDFRKMLLNKGDWTDSLERLQEAQAVFVRTNDLRGQGTGSFFIGLVHQRLQQKEEALAHFTTALNLAEQTGDKFEESEVVRHLGFFAFMDGRIDEAYDHAQRSLSLREDINCQVALSSAHHVVGMAQEARDDLPAALTSYEQARVIAQRLTLKVPLIQALLGLAGVYQQQARMTEAMTCARQAHRVAKETGYPVFMQAAANKLSEVAG